MTGENNIKPQVKNTEFYLQIGSYIILLFIPIILITTSLKSIDSISKNWYGGGYDPSYAYLYNSLNIATLKQPGHIDHPGTPMQIIGGIILRTAWTLHPEDGKSLAEAVISEPEHYLGILNRGTALLGSFLIILAGFFTFKISRNLWYSLIIQSTPFISGIILYSAYLRISQESVLMIASVAMSVYALHWYYNNEKHSARYFSTGFGIISGFGIASKVIFIPLIIIPLLLLAERKDRVRFIKVTVINFLICTIPIITLYPNMGWWFIKLFIHSGIYGSGSISVIEPESYINSLKVLLAGELIYLFSYLTGLIYILIKFIRLKNWKVFIANPSNKLLFAIVLVQTLGYLITAKHPKFAYLLPYECLAPVLIILIINALSKFLTSHRLRLASTIALSLIVVIPIISFRIAERNNLLAETTKERYEQTWQIAELAAKDGAIIGINPGSSPIAANFFANAYSFDRYSELLSKTYPDYYIYDTYGNRLITWEYDTITLDSLARKYHNRIVLTGDDVDQIAKLLTRNIALSFEKLPTPISEVAVLKGS